MKIEQKSRPVTPYFVFLKEQRAKGKTIGHKEGGRLWANLSKKEKHAYESEYRKKVDDYERYLAAHGFKPRTASSNCGEKFTPLGKTEPDRIRAKRVHIVCGSSREVLPCTKDVYRGLGRVVEVFIDSIGKEIEDERRKNWEPIINTEMVYKAAANVKMFDKINGAAFILLLEMKELNLVISELIKKEEKKKRKSSTDDEEDAKKRKKK
eukprot:TRINITY_DN1677_c0_g1_i2.p1 TRINITY_DN1677_c0_g1~~TRINITY_DN1677_c0_g1_i2.p1  ORF type:complete len:209 (-),score=73.67 TRINITY_DN1677_c0_g1_i2:185-811(-)